MHDPRRTVLAVLRRDEDGVVRNERYQPVDEVGRLIRQRGIKQQHHKAAVATGAKPLIDHYLTTNLH